MRSGTVRSGWLCSNVVSKPRRVLEQWHLRDVNETQHVCALCLCRRAAAPPPSRSDGASGAEQFRRQLFPGRF